MRTPSKQKYVTLADAGSSGSTLSVSRNPSALRFVACPHEHFLRSSEPWKPRDARAGYVEADETVDDEVDP